MSTRPIGSSLGHEYGAEQTLLSKSRSCSLDRDLPDCVFFFDSVSLPRMRRSVVLRSSKFWMSHILFPLSLLSLYSKSQTKTTVRTAALSTYFVAASMANSTVALDSTKTRNIIFMSEFEILSRKVKFITGF